MGKRTKIILVSLISLVVLVVGGTIVVNAVATSKIEKFLQNSLPPNVTITYDNLDVSVWNGHVKLSDLNISMFGNTTDEKTIQIKQKALLVNGLSVWKFLLNDEINIDSILLEEPNVEYDYNKLIPKGEYDSSKPKGIQKDIKVGKLKLSKGALFINDATNDSLIMKLRNLDFEMSNIFIDNQTIRDKIPFLFEDYKMEFDDFFYRLNEFDHLKLQHASVSQRNAKFENVNLYTKYSRKELSKQLSVERDHVDLKIQAITIADQEFGYKTDSLFYFKSPKVTLQNPNLNIFRDKLVADDPAVKSLYSKMLKDLNFDLTLSELIIEDGAIKYTERVKEDNTGGSILFSELDATAKNVSNTYSAPNKTEIDINAVFMKATPIKVEWEFDVNNANDHFMFQAEVGKLAATDMNIFSEPNLRVKMEGEVNKTYFTIDGNVNTSAVNLRMNYDNFKVMVLDKEGQQKNKLLSAVANLFIKKDSDKSEDKFREGNKTGVERDKTKSVFNFLWLNVRAGLLSAMTGDGKK